MNRRRTRLLGIVLWLALAPVAAAQPAKVPGKAPDREQLLKQAASELSQGRRTEAARLLRTAGEQHGSVRAWLQLARIQSGDGNSSGALESLRIARKLAPNSEEVLIAFAQLSIAAKNPMLAVPTLQTLTQMCPTAPEYHYQLGVALLLTGDAPAAAEVLERAERLDPLHGLTLMAAGLALNTQNRYGEARKFLARSVEILHDNVDALAALAEAEEGLGDVEPADTHARRALSINGAHAGANLVMGLLFLRAERYGDARDALLRGVLSDPDNPKLHYQLSLAYARLGDEANAKKHVDLYQHKRREEEERLRSLRGTPRGGPVK